MAFSYDDLRRSLGSSESSAGGKFDHTVAVAHRGDTHRTRHDSVDRLRCAALKRLHDTCGIKSMRVYRRALMPMQDCELFLPPGYTVRQVPLSELVSTHFDPAIGMTADFLGAAASRGDICFGVFFGLDLVAYSWYAVSGLAPFLQGLSVRNTYPKQVYGYRVFTHPDHWGKRLRSLLRHFGDARLLERGYTHNIFVVDSHNLSSTRGLSRISQLTLVGRIVSLRMFGRHCTLSSPGNARYGFYIRRAH